GRPPPARRAGVSRRGSRLSDGGDTREADPIGNPAVRRQLWSLTGADAQDVDSAPPHARGEQLVSVDRRQVEQEAPTVARPGVRSIDLPGHFLPDLVAAAADAGPPPRDRVIWPGAVFRAQRMPGAPGNPRPAAAPSWGGERQRPPSRIIEHDRVA